MPVQVVPERKIDQIIPPSKVSMHFFETRDNSTATMATWQNRNDAPTAELHRDAKLTLYGGYTVTSTPQCCWHLEQEEDISITQRVHYEWIMHRPTRLDTQQSECQNSLEHTFFSPCSPNIMLKKGNLESRPPIHYFNVTKAAKKKREGSDAETGEKWRKRPSAWQKLH